MRTLLLFGLLATVLQLGAAPSPSFQVIASTANEFGVSTEKSFPSAYATTIWPWFESEGTKGVFDGARGVKLHYRAFVQKDRNAEKGAIVISSGRTEGLIIYPELLHDLWSQGYSLYIHDHRGQGFSGGRIGGLQRGDVFAFDDFVADLNTFVETVVRKQNHRKLFLLAHSMGGGIASLYLERHPGIFNAAVLVSPMHDPLLPGPLTSKDRTAEICTLAMVGRAILNPANYAIGQADFDPNLRFDQQTDLTHSPIRWDHTRRMYRQYAGAQVGGPTHRWIREACDAAESARDDASAIDIPILLIQAGDDVVVRNDAQREFCEAARQCKGVVIPGARHALFIEHDDFRLPLLNETIRFLNAESRR